MSNEPPEFWSCLLEEACVTASDAAFPNEVSGIIYTDATGSFANLQVFNGISSETSVDASPHEVVEFAYWLQSHHCLPIATFHSHPGGQEHFSKRDEALQLWASQHVIVVRQQDSWKCMFFVSSL
ncbi:Mov34/MPN/PAD-1 family protein [Alicyclobacillus mengziensis]|uniref:Mov34/MPN/PAD-1 family protein n=1 Tax=Alicyclobacillus mengziensis TaxID=2931921 RepID=A0A9X7Z643_9BACL|nr:Mov34/MPN/PAD-1 family protein [Alicyclobacillus mengziensis]QSO45905.1 Mov34/MPN/PAD-1 family protein [Alicyclobacillus mengziensis]